jgi:hypothetical protein
MKLKVFAHGAYIGTTGYANHTRDFFRNLLSEYVDVKVSNFTIGPGWNWPDSEPHNNESYINDVDKKLLVEQTLWDGDKRTDYSIYPKHPNEFIPRC